MVGRGVVKLEKDVPTAAGAGNVMKPWPDSRTSLRFDIIHNMLPPTMAVTSAITNGQDVQVHNLNGGMAWVQAHHLTLTDALRLLMAETARNGISGQHAQHALDNIRLRDGESWLTGLNRLVQLARAASLLPDRPYLSEEPYYWMVLTAENLYHLMNRAVALCFPVPTDRVAFHSYLVGAMVNTRATLQLHPIDSHALGSPQMAARGKICASCYHDFTRTLGQNACFYNHPTTPSKGAPVSALRTSSRRLPPGEDTFTRQTRTRRSAFALRDDDSPDEWRDDDSHDEYDTDEVAAYGNHGDHSSTSATRAPSDTRRPRTTDRDPSRHLRHDSRGAAASGVDQRKRERQDPDNRDTRRYRRAPAQSTAPAARGPTQAPRLAADAPAPHGDPQVIEAYIKAQGVCFHHARGRQCRHMAQHHHCRYLHTADPIPFGTYPPPAHNLSAVDGYDENTLHAVDSAPAWTTPYSAAAAAAAPATAAPLPAPEEGQHFCSVPGWRAARCGVCSGRRRESEAGSASAATPPPTTTSVGPTGGTFCSLDWHEEEQPDCDSGPRLLPHLAAMEARRLDPSAWVDEGCLSWPMTLVSKQHLPGRVSTLAETALPGPQPHTKQLLVVFPRAQFDKEKGASIHVARGVQWWTPGIAPKLKLVNHYTSSKSIDQGIEVATAYATNCDDVERMLLWKERPPAPPPAPPPPPTTSPPQGATIEPSVCVDEANTGQLGYESRRELLAIIAKAKGLFPTSPKIVEALPGREVPIPLVDENVTPVACKQQKYNPIQADIVNKQVDLWLATGVIRPSTSSWCCRTSIVPKKDGSNRLTIDYRPLNAVTKKDSGGIGTLATMHHRIKGSNFFTLLDLPSAYHQLSIKEPDPHLGDTLRPVENKGHVERWLDDILLHSATLAEHLSLINEVFDLLQRAGYSVHFRKSMFCMAEVEFLGAMVGRAGIRPAPSKIQAVRELEMPWERSEHS
eukprot:g15718.t2